MKKSNKPIFWNPISTMIGQVEVTGEYALDGDGFMTVRLPGGGSKSAKGGPAAESVARIILGELFREYGRTQT
jgi:hypothetical protein